MQSFRICRTCQKRKWIGEFVKNANSKDGFRNLCLECNRTKNLLFYRERLIRRGHDPVVVEARSKKKTKNERIRESLGKAAGHKIIQMHASARRRAREKGLEFDITLDDLADLYVQECPIFKTKLNWEHRGTGASHSSPSLDRKIPSLGYVKGNLWIVSHRANTIKSDATPEELIAVADAMFYC